MAAASELERQLVRQGLRTRRVPFDFRRRVDVARTYLDDGAWLTCADRLEALALEIRAAAHDRDAGRMAAIRGAA